jgi:Ni,Fe-hydrogenase III small subunit/ferredoxin-like protein FixX
MIFDIAKRSLQSARVLIPVEALASNAIGSRMPEIVPSKLNAAVAQRLVNACPTSALSLQSTTLALDYGECTGCGDCVQAGAGAVKPASHIAQCGVSKSGLVRRWNVETGAELPVDAPQMTAAAAEIRALLGRALNVREVDAGSCNGCEQEIIALTSPYYDLERFGVHFVASPKHADMLLVTGPVTRNMAEAVRQTYAVTPSPKLVVAVGACACSGGLFAGSYAVEGPPDKVIPVDAYIPGCPPTPAMLLTGMLRALQHAAIKQSLPSSL